MPQAEAERNFVSRLKSRRSSAAGSGFSIDDCRKPPPACRVPRYLLVDISNSFTKAALSDGRKLGRVWRVPTRELSMDSFNLERVNGIVVSSVVPKKTALFRRRKLPPVIEVGAGIDLGIAIDYPNPERIGADRLANAVACAELHGCPAIVVDFGTAVTFDVLSAQRAYIGGIIAPGLSAMTDYLHEKTALLPRVSLAEPLRIIGKSTEEAMRVGAVVGYRGLIEKLVREISAEAFRGRKVPVVATGGDARLIAAGLPLFTAVDPELTLRGLQLIARQNFPLAANGASREFRPSRDRQT